MVGIRGGGNQQHAGSVTEGRQEPGAAVLSLHSTESVKLHQALLCSDMLTDTHTYTPPRAHPDVFAICLKI